MPPTFNGRMSDVTVGTPGDSQHDEQFFPDGQYCAGFTRRGLPSEVLLDRMTLPRLSGREDGYLPSNIDEAETANRRLRRSFRITEGNTTGDFPGPPDRTR